MTPFTQEFTVCAMHTDCFGRAKPSTLLYYIQEAAGGHCNLLELDWDTLQKKGLFWAVIRTRVEVTRLPSLGETICVETWPMPTTRSAFPRATAAYDREGKLLFRAISLWVLMDTEKRSMVLPAKSGLTVPGILRGEELEAPGSIAPLSGEPSVRRQVQYTELDRNGHMNNTRYLDWAADLLPGSFHKANPIRNFCICYLAEAREGDPVGLNFSLSEDGFFHADGFLADPDTAGRKVRIFSVQAQF